MVDVATIRDSALKFSRTCVLVLYFQNIHEATEKFISQQRQEREAVLQVNVILEFSIEKCLFS